MGGLSGYHIMIVSKYFKTIKDFINLELVSKKFRGNMEKFHFNPIPLNYTTIRYFPKIETLHLWNRKEENFFNGIFIPIEYNEYKIVYKNINDNKEDIIKKIFYAIIIWYNVNYGTYEMNKYKNFKFKNISYTDNDRKIYSDTIPTNVIKIGNQCYSDNVEIIEIIIAKNVKIIGEYCFNRCIKLKNVIIPSSVRSIIKFFFVLFVII
ncbi:hypothetical protein EIN_353060 [Entamoeba invadens IP1]|uniref:Leucine rich repeat containing protein BspA family protein n=1 Tax=Entamoeba invadens IP1 TaxID=370355 RepID=L7FP04_ENTIV|nr:hypothetical protein EIN_353060 [Entamoeba invadens IP1]ELP95314.1 hypothetical protein EIN_353060 [Entamoeba invadens IP1]|eukprot:XP_004262085.1 hypothetical protein EIN_353060 [Entamoeba invadens IP1]